MKKFFEEHDLFKLAGIMMLISAILSWILVYSYYSSGSLTVFTDSTMVGLTRSIFDESTVSIFDFNTYGLLSLYYFTITFVYVAVVAGFYKFLGSLNAYKKLTDKVADVFKGKEKLFIAISILLYAVLASLSTDYMSLLVFVPFTITILHKLGMDKITSLISSFGGILLGILGSTYSTKVAGMLVDSTYGIGVSYGYDFVIVLCISVIAYATLLYLTFTRLGKLKKNDKDIVPDMFASEEVEVKKDSKKKSHYVNIVPLAIVLGIVGLIVVLAYIGWSTALGVDAFNNAYTWFTDATLFGYPLFSVLLGTTTFKAFGSWDLFGAASLMIIATIIIKIIYKVPFDTIISEYGNGLKKILKSIILLMM
ncbi:MAG TPA: hypothetical protein PLC25_02725, partial [Bacilli bacterium]|nr:hypothetical protein [Bacilli bacterium]